MKFRIKRVYEPPADGDGHRVLVDALWPRGVARERARIDRWCKEVAPSHELRKWFGHDPEKWVGFLERYFAELDAGPDARELLAPAEGGDVVTLLYSARDEERNQAVALSKYLRRLS